MVRSIQDPINRFDCFRLLCLLFLLAIFLALVIFSFYKLQIVEVDKWKLAAKKQHFFYVNEPFMRGSFISNTSVKENHPEKVQKFVADIEKFHLHIDPQSIPVDQKDHIAEELIAQLSLSHAQGVALKAQLQRKSRNRKLAKWLDIEQRDKILNWWQPYAKKQGIARNALFHVVDYQRVYPFGKLLGQLLHTTRGQKDSDTQQSTPTGGLELQFDHYLKGHQGKRRLMRSPKNSFEMGEIIRPPAHGADIHLTINHCLQAIVEEELEKGINRYRAKCGWALMMAPKSGEILAIAQYPFFHPAEYQQSFSTLEGIETTQLKGISYAYEPGSVMKPITLYAALLANEILKSKGQAPLFDPYEIVPTSNSKFKGRAKPLKDTRLHYHMNMEMAIQKSANIYFCRLTEKIIERLGAQWYRDLLHDTFGFGEKTGVEFPCEAKGMMPTIGKRYASGAMEWSGGTHLSLAIGYNLQVNSLQILRAYAMLVNGGFFVKPTLVRQIVQTASDSEDKIILDNTRSWENAPRRLMPGLLKDILLSMKYTTKPGGTAPEGDIPGYTEAGKSSTFEKIVNGKYSKTCHGNSFIGFAPFENPEFVLYVIVDEPEYGFQPGIGKLHHGGVTSGPIFKEIAKRSLQYLGVAPDDPYGYPYGDPRYNSEKADWVPNTQKLRDSYKKWNTALLR